MDLKILMVILFYYMAISVILVIGVGATGDATMTGYVNTSAPAASEMDKGGLFGTGIDFGRFFGLVTIGVGLPSDTPSWASALFIIWQSGWLVFTLGFVIASIWNG